MKKFTTILVSIILGINAIGQTPAITATSAKAAGSTISLDIKAVAANTPIQIDFGDGVKVDKIIGTSSNPIDGTLGSSQTLKIYGSGIRFFQCYLQELTTLDVSNCPALEFLSVPANSLTGLDVTKNTALVSLATYGNYYLNSLDLTKNKALTNLTCYLNNLTTIDLSQNTELTYLSIGINSLKTLDVSKNTKLEILYSRNNDLSQLDISANPLIEELICSGNQLAFSSIPLNRGTFTDYEYSPQKAITITKNATVGTELDLSSEYSVGGNTTTYTWKTKTGGLTLVAGTDYTITSGKTTFLKPQADSVYCEMTNATFPSLAGANALKTTNVKVKELEMAISMTTTKAAGSSITFYLMVNASTTLQIDFGDGNKINKPLNTDHTTITGTVGNSQTIKIYGDGIKLFSCSGLDLTALDVSKCTSLKDLYCSENKLASLNVTSNTLLEELICSGSPISALDISKNTALTKLVCLSNKLKQLDVSNNKALKFVSCGFNQLSFATLPVKQAAWTDYYYAPQSPLPIAKRITTGTALDLSSQHSISGNTTTYLWKTENNVNLVAGVDYTVANGKITFLKPQIDSVFCMLANATFPDLSVNNIYYTTFIKIVGSQTITFNSLSAKKVNDAPFTISATATSGLPVTFTSSDPTIASVSGNTVTIKKAGSVTITAAQTGNGTWETAPSVTQTLNISKAAQTITFGALSPKKAGDAAFELTAIASSGLPVTYTSSNSLVASISGSTVTILKVGTVTITATQAGNDNWGAATAEQSLAITSTTDIDEEKENIFSVYPNPVADILYFKGEGSDNMTVSIFNLLGTKVWSGMVKGQNINVAQLPAGVYILKISTIDKKEKTMRFVKK